MTTVLLTRGHDARAVEARRCGAALRVLAYARAHGLDRALARGTDPDSGALLSVRAHALIGRAHRLRLAYELRRVLRVAGRVPHRFNPTLPVPYHVLLARDLIEEIADTLEGPEPVEVRGVAKLELLLRDGGGPIYGTARAASLRDLLENIIRALALWPTIHADA
jgi:hypothetical protein